MRVLILTAWLGSLLALCACAKTECPHDSVFVPAGTFEMGMRKPAWGVWQLEPRKVTLTESYCMDRTEVTYRAYEACENDGPCVRPPGKSAAPELRLEMPRAFIDWADARRFCDWRGGRLPTEAEWEYAARYPDGRLYPWGNEPPTTDRWHWNQRRSPIPTVPVGQYPKGRSYLGLEDMTGNLGEWTQDYFGFHHPQPDVDPTGPDEGLPLDPNTRVVRGASWAAVDERMAVATYRQGGDRVYGDDQTGFRCVYPPR